MQFIKPLGKILGLDSQMFRILFAAQLLINKYKQKLIYKQKQPQKETKTKSNTDIFFNRILKFNEKKNENEKKITLNDALCNVHK